jgi:hypothetical protein
MLYETDETFLVDLTNPTNASVQDGQAVCTISNDDTLPAITTTNIQISEGSSGITEVTIPITLSTISGVTATVDYVTVDGNATAPADYTARSGTLSFPPETTGQQVTIPIAADMLAEGTETFTIMLSNSTNARLGTPAQAIVSITDVPPPVIQFSTTRYTVSETITRATILVTRSGDTSQPATVSYATRDGTATAGSDYTSSSGTLTFTVGASSATFTVPLKSDLQAETDETVRLTLSTPTSATLGVTTQATLTIVDERVALTSVTLAGATQVMLDATTLFTATVTPSDTTLPVTYTWQVSDQDDDVVHTVSSLQDILQRSWSTPGTKGITVTVANGAGVVSATHTIQVGQPVAWNLLFYMSGDKDTANQKYVQATDDEDMINMLETIAENTHVNILVLWDDYGDNNTRLYHLQHDTDTKTITSPPLAVDWNPGERNMGDPQTLQDFVQWARAEYPAQHTLLTVYDHGCGWAPHLSDTAQQATWMQGGSGLAWDETDGDYLANREIGSALQTIANSGGKLDVVFYDASLNAMLENAYEIRDSADYLVASQNTMNTSFPYDTSLDSDTITADTTAAELATALVAGYGQLIIPPMSNVKGTISAITLSKIDELAAQVETLATALRQDVGGANITKLEKSYLTAQKFDLDEQRGIEQEREAAIDLQHFAELVAAEKVSPAVTQAANAVVTTMEQGVILAEKHSTSMFGLYKFLQVHGLSIYLPFGEETYVGTGCGASGDYCKIPAGKTCLRVRDYYTNADPTQLAFVQETSWDEWIHETIAQKYPCTSSVIRTTDALTESAALPTMRPVNIISSPLPGKMDLTLIEEEEEPSEEQTVHGVYLPLIRR